MAEIDWPTKLVGECPALDDLDEDVQSSLKTMAGDYLWRVTGYQFGITEVSLRPCSERYFRAQSTFWGYGPYPHQVVSFWAPTLIHDRWFPVGCGCSHSCVCDVRGPSVVELPGRVEKVDSVRIDGIESDEDDYRLDFGNRLIKRTGTWPTIQDMTRSPERGNTFEVQYQRGKTVPTGGEIAAGQLACELAKAYTADNTCQLPQRVQTVTRQGVTVGVMDDFEGLEKGMTGIWTIDSWIQSVLQKRPATNVVSPDQYRAAGEKAWPRT